MAENHFTLGRQDYQWIHEPILYDWKEGTSHYFINDRTLASVLETDPNNYKKMNKTELLEVINNILNIRTSVIKDNPKRQVMHKNFKELIE